MDARERPMHRAEVTSGSIPSVDFGLGAREGTFDLSSLRTALDNNWHKIFILEDARISLTDISGEYTGERYALLYDAAILDKPDIVYWNCADPYPFPMRLGSQAEYYIVDRAGLRSAMVFGDRQYMLLLGKPVINGKIDYFLEEDHEILAAKVVERFLQLACNAGAGAVYKAKRAII